MREVDVNDLRVEDIMTNLVVMLYPNDSIHDAASRLARNRISGAPVVEEGKVVGIVSEADLIYALAPPAPVRRNGSLLDLFSLIVRAKPRWHAENKRVEDVMVRNVITIHPGASVWTAASVMDAHGVKRLPVVDDEDQLVGVLSRADLVKTLARTDEEIAAEVLDAIKSLDSEDFTALYVEVDEGVATVSGLADRKTTKELAIAITARSPGVVEVKDELNYGWDDSHLKAETDGPDPRKFASRPQV
jgi:CBS domain-containing protein